MANKIRNISQSQQEREIIKTAPDVVVYVEGNPYMLNPYIYDVENDNSEGTVVNFNDHVVNFSVTYDVDNMIPSANITLSVPNFQKHLYQSPGGNNLFETMMQVQVFAKGYFPSASGNTVYRRIFKGLISHVAHTDTGTMLEISLQCLGILHFMELMQIELSAALLSNSEIEVTPLTSNQANLTPYGMLADVFLRTVALDGFQVASLQDGSRIGDWKDAVEAGYVSKWQKILSDLQRDVHIFGFDKFKNTKATDKNGVTQPTKEAEGSMDPRLKIAKTRVASTKSIVDQLADKDYNVDLIRGFLPDASIGSIKLTDHRITSRLERLRTVANLIGYEGYQDVDGAIIFKPPFYNLDVTNIGNTSLNGDTITSRGPMDFTDETNPFVVHLSEIESESESEDQQAVRETSIVIQPDWLPNWHMNTANNILLPFARHIDIPKLAKFGLREQPSRQLPFIGAPDKLVLYTYAVSELNRANRGWRTYSMTIPMRPELKLGFPMYVPHKDMYGYIKTITYNYQYAGAATTTITLDTIRKRPVFPAEHKVTQTVGDQVIDKKYNIYTTQPNLVMKWTKPPQEDQGDKATTKPATMSDEGTSSSNLRANQLGAPATQRQPNQKPPNPQEREVVNTRRQQFGTSWATRSDTRSNSFRVQKDEADDADTTYQGKSTGVKKGEPFFSADNWYNPNGQVGINMQYCQKILTCQPYTDEGGYELVTPFPWGRWQTLTQAIYATRLGTISNIIDPTNTPNPGDAETLRGVDTFVFAGVGQPVDLSPAQELSRALNPLTSSNSVLNKSLSDIFAATSMDAVFELESPKPGEKGTDVLLGQRPQPDNTDANRLSKGENTILANLEESVSERTDLFIMGQPSVTDALDADFNTITDAQTGKIYQYGEDSGQTVPKPQKTPQQMSFLDKLFNKGQ